MPLFIPPPPPHLIIANEGAGETGASGTLSALTVYLYAYEVLVTETIVATGWHNAATTTGTTNMGIYLYSQATGQGTLVTGSDTGAQTNTANTSGKFTYAGNGILLPVGQYFIALSPSNSTDTFQTTSPLAANQSRMKRATNVLAAGALPASTGVIVANVAAGPAMNLYVLNGLT